MNYWKYTGGGDYLAIYDNNYLSHHGILEQKWGKRNGPPYPLGSGGKAQFKEKNKQLKKEYHEKTRRDFKRVTRNPEYRQNLAKNIGVAAGMGAGVSMAVSAVNPVAGVIGGVSSAIGTYTSNQLRQYKNVSSANKKIYESKKTQLISDINKKTTSDLTAKLNAAGKEHTKYRQKDYDMVNSGKYGSDAYNKNWDNYEKSLDNLSKIEKSARKMGYNVSDMHAHINENRSSRGVNPDYKLEYVGKRRRR